MNWSSCSHLYELVELFGEAQFGVAVDEQCGVVGAGVTAAVECLQVQGQVTDTLCVQILRNRSTQHGVRRRNKSTDGGRMSKHQHTGTGTELGQQK